MNIKNKLTLLGASAMGIVSSAMSTVFANDGGKYDGSSYLGGLGIDTAAKADSTYTNVNNTLLTILNFARGAGVVVCVIMLVWCAIQLASSAGNQQKRQIAMEGIKNVLIAVAIIGGATIIASLAYGILKQ